MKKIRLICCFCLVLVGLLAVWAPGIALAQDEEEPTPVLISAPEEEEEDADEEEEEEEDKQEQKEEGLFIIALNWQ